MWFWFILLISAVISDKRWFISVRTSAISPRTPSNLTSEFVTDTLNLASEFIADAYDLLIDFNETLVHPFFKPFYSMKEQSHLVL